MKTQHRVPTTNSNKTNKTLSKPLRDRENSIELPKINKSNYDTNSNPSNYENDFQNFQANKGHGIILEKNDHDIDGIVNYNKMTMEEIKIEYQRLREQVESLYTAVKKAKSTMQSRILKKPTKTSNNSEKVIKQLDDELYNNNFLLQKLRLQVQNLQRRSNLANSNISKPNISLNDRILDSKQKIFQIKQKIKLLKRKTKKAGNDIVNVDQFQDDLTKLQREEYAYLTKQSKLQAKNQQISYKLQNSIQKLEQIDEEYKKAEQFHKEFNVLEAGQYQEKELFNIYRQKQYFLQILSKKMESSQQTNLQNYHQLLKNLQGQGELLQKMQQKLISSDMKILKSKQSALELEQCLQEITKVYQQVLAQEKQNLQKQSTFLTAQYNVLGIKSIIQQNQSQVRQEQNHQKKKFLFTKLERLPLRRQSVITKSINSSKNVQNEGKSFFLSTKQIKQKREAHRSSAISQNTHKVSANRTSTNVPNKFSQDQVKPIKNRINSTLKKQSSQRKPYMKIQSRNQDLKGKDAKIQLPNPNNKQTIKQVSKNLKTDPQKKNGEISSIRKMQLQIEMQLKINKETDFKAQEQNIQKSPSGIQEKLDLHERATKSGKNEQIDSRNNQTQTHKQKIQSNSQNLDESLQVKNEQLSHIHKELEVKKQKKSIQNLTQGQLSKMAQLNQQDSHKVTANKIKQAMIEIEIEDQIKLLTNESQKQSKVKKIDQLLDSGFSSESQLQEAEGILQVQEQVQSHQQLKQEKQQLQRSQSQLKESYHIQKDNMNAPNQNMYGQFGDFQFRPQE